MPPIFSKPARETPESSTSQRTPRKRTLAQKIRSTDNIHEHALKKRRLNDGASTSAQAPSNLKQNKTHQPKSMATKVPSVPSVPPTVTSTSRRASVEAVDDEEDGPPASRLHPKNNNTILEEVDGTDKNEEPIENPKNDDTDIEVMDEITEIAEEEELSKLVTQLSSQILILDQQKNFRKNGAHPFMPFSDLRFKSTPLMVAAFMNSPVLQNIVSIGVAG